MKEKNHIYEKTIEELRKLSPQLERPKELTRKIIREVEKTPQKVRPKSKLFTLLSGIAATLLLCLWGYEILRYPVYPVSASAPAVLFSHPLQPKEESYSTQEKINLYKVWQQQQQKNKERQKQFILTLSNQEKTIP